MISLCNSLPHRCIHRSAHSRPPEVANLQNNKLSSKSFQVTLVRITYWQYVSSPALSKGMPDALTEPVKARVPHSLMKEFNEHNFLLFINFCASHWLRYAKQKTNDKINNLLSIFVINRWTATQCEDEEALLMNVFG